MNQYRHIIPAVLIALCMPNPLAAADLMEIYTLAIENDPVYKQSIARRNAVLESRPQALARLLPDIALGANASRHYQDISTSGFGESGTVDFSANGYRLSLSQPIFRRDRLIGLNQADSRILEAEAQALNSGQDLIIRVAENYFNILQGQDNLDFSGAEKKSLDRQLEQARQQFEVGLSAITDVREAEAGYDRAVADEIRATNELDNEREAMREIINQYPQSLLSPLSEDLPLLEPDPSDIDQWLARALEQNLDVIAATHALAVAEKTITLQTAERYPTLDLLASHDFDDRGGRFGDTEVHTSQIGLELNLPIFRGGAINSRIREARQNYHLAIERLEQARRAAQRNARQAYLGVISGISQVKALKQALVSSETALKATRAGFEVGTRTAVDVVAAERNVLSSRRDYSRARYNYLLNSLSLKQAAGTLSSEDLRHLRQWLD